MSSSEVYVLFSGAQLMLKSRGRIVHIKIYLENKKIRKMVTLV